MPERRTGHRRGWVDWLFASRRDGRIVIGQWPNPLLWTYVALATVRAVLHPGGVRLVVVSGLATAVLAVWAVEEVGWGVNPFRRALGLVVFAVQLVQVASALVRA